MMIIDTAARRANSLTDSEINELLDAYLFGHSPLCLGISADDGTGIYRCQWCGEIDNLAVPSNAFDVRPWHHRLAPQYTMEQIVEQLQQCDKSAQIVYMFSLRSQIFGDTTQAIRRSALAEQTQLLIHHSWRRVAVAALMAIGVVDEQGYLRKDFEI